MLFMANTAIGYLSNKHCRSEAMQQPDREGIFGVRVCYRIGRCGRSDAVIGFRLIPASLGLKEIHHKTAEPNRRIGSSPDEDSRMVNAGDNASWCRKSPSMSLASSSAKHWSS